MDPAQKSEPSLSTMKEAERELSLKQFCSEFQGMLKTPVGLPSPYPDVHQGEVLPIPKVVLDKKVIAGEFHILIHWAGLSPSKASWELATHIEKQYPTFALEVKRFLEGGSNVMNNKPDQQQSVQVIPFHHYYKRRGQTKQLRRAA